MVKLASALLVSLALSCVLFANANDDEEFPKPLPGKGKPKKPSDKKEPPPGTPVTDYFPRNERPQVPDDPLRNNDTAIKFKDCKEEERIVQKFGIFGSNGCGSSGFSISLGKGSDDFTPCCDQHDVCYSLCGVARETCEDRFSKCLNEICAKSNDASKCESNAGIFQMGASAMGGAAFEKAQKDACKCLPEREVPKHYGLMSNVIRDEAYKYHERGSNHPFEHNVTEIISNSLPTELDSPKHERNPISSRKLRGIRLAFYHINNMFPQLIRKEKGHPEFGKKPKAGKSKDEL